MGVYNATVITNAGQNLIASAIAGGQAINFTAVKTSTHVYPAGTALQNLTSLSDVKQTVAPTSVDVYNNSVVQISARVPNTGIATAYLINTIGLFGSAGGGAETLIAVLTAQTPDEVPVFDAEAPAAFIFNVQMSIQNANAITMVVNDTGTATVADLNRKVNLNGGDLSDTVVDTFTAAAAEYPVPAAGDSLKVIGGKIAKFCADIVKTFTGATSSAIGKKGLVPAPSAGQQTAYMRGDGTWVQPQNNATTTEAGYVLDAKMGKTLDDKKLDKSDTSYFCFRQAWPKSCNSCLTSGWYLINHDATDGPPELSWKYGILLVWNSENMNNSNWVYQIYLGEERVIYFRNSVNSASFSSWTKI